MLKKSLKKLRLLAEHTQILKKKFRHVFCIIIIPKNYFKNAKKNCPINYHHFFLFQTNLLIFQNPHEFSSNFEK